MKHLPSFRHSYPSLNALGSHGTSGCPSASAAELVDISNKLPPLTTSSSSHTFAQQRRSYSCDIAPSNESYAPLTEANLKYHTNKVASTSGRYKKSLRVELYVLSQKKILALEAELEQQRISESKAFVPLDSTPEQPLLTDVSQARVNKKRRSSSSKKFFSWFRATIASSSSSSSAAAGTSSSSITTTDHPSPLPATTTPPLSPSNNTSNYYYNQYRQEKMALIEQGLSNTTVASALGMNSSFASALFTPSSCSTGTSTGAVPKRDSGISFFAALSPRSSRRRTATLDGKDRRRRRSSISATENEACWDSNSLIAFRYPKMVHLQTLREAAIHALSSDIAADDNCCTATEKRTCCCFSL